MHIEKDEERSITNVRSYRGPDANSDHFIVEVKVKQLIPKTKNQNGKKNRSRSKRRLKEEDKVKYAEELNKNLQ